MTTDPIIEFGKHKGKRLSEVPEGYILWIIKSRKEDIALYEAELARREAAQDADADMVERLIKTGFRELMKRVHPDVGGTDAEARELNAAFQKLKDLHF